MTKSTKIMIVTIASVVLVILAWVVGFSWVVVTFSIPTPIAFVTSFVVVYGFLQSPWYLDFMDFVEDQLEKVIK